MRRSIKPILIVALNMAVCAALGLLPFFLSTALLLLFAHMTNLKWLWLIPGLLLIAIRIPQDSFAIGIGASVMLMQLWTVLRMQKTNYLQSLGSVTWFASLPAGPIHRNNNLIAEARWTVNQEPATYLCLAQGFLKCGMGIFLSQHLVDFDRLIEYGSSATVLILSLASILLFYCQLSGMTDLALGISKFFNITLPENFREPWRARDLADFWRRWHISLNQWFFHEVYFPLAVFFQGRFPRAGSFMAAGVLLATAILMGLWHGFHSVLLCWGILNGILLLTSNFFKGPGSRGMSSVFVWISVLILFLLMRLSTPSGLVTAFQKLVIFRAQDFANALPSVIIVTAGFLLISLMNGSWNFKSKFWPAFVLFYGVLGFLLGHSDGQLLYPGF